MKRILFCTVCLAAMSHATMAQDVYDLARLANQDLNGTAKFVGMGGAMSALGGDITTMATNPAGIGILRGSNISATTSLQMLNNPGQLRDNRVSFDQFGVVISTNMGKYSDVRYINFGVNYRKRTNLFDSFGVINNWDGDFSQTYQMVEMTYGEPDVRNMPDLARLGVESGVVIDNDTEYVGTGANNTYFNTIQTGGVHEINTSIAANWNDQLFLGFSVGYYDVNLERSSFYREDGVDGCSYDLYNDYLTRGSGIDFKLGAIYRPIEDSGFRFGVSVHSPIFYDLTDSNAASIKFYDEKDKQIGRSSVSVDPVDYKVITPWTFNFSLGHTISNIVALGAEYELNTFQSMRLREYDNTSSRYTRYVDETCREFLKTQHTLRLGLEIKPVPMVSLRAGYNYQTATFDEGAYRCLVDFTDMGIDNFTDTQHENTLDVHRWTAGLGFNLGSAYLDIAYQYSKSKNHFYAFDSNLGEDDKVYYLPTTVNNKSRHQLMATLGFRF